MIIMIQDIQDFKIKLHYNSKYDEPIVMFFSSWFITTLTLNRLLQIFRLSSVGW